MPATTGLPSAIVSLESIASVKEKLSVGCPVMARGLLAVWPGAGAPPVVAGVQACVMVSGLYWKMMTLGIGIGKVSLNSISPPFIVKPAITQAFREVRRRRVAQVDHRRRRSGRG